MRAMFTHVCHPRAGTKAHKHTGIALAEDIREVRVVWARCTVCGDAPQPTKTRLGSPAWEPARRLSSLRYKEDGVLCWEGGDHCITV